jgi:hypothetical protein
MESMKNLKLEDAEKIGELLKSLKFEGFEGIKELLKNLKFEGPEKIGKALKDFEENLAKRKGLDPSLLNEILKLKLSQEGNELIAKIINDSAQIEATKKKNPNDR